MYNECLTKGFRFVFSVLICYIFKAVLFFNERKKNVYLYHCETTVILFCFVRYIKSLLSVFYIICSEYLLLHCKYS